jgi:hypothetical protein
VARCPHPAGTCTGYADDDASKPPPASATTGATRLSPPHRGETPVVSLMTLHP